jgi:hypothetical protein
MAEIVNLRMARKRAARKEREALAEANRATHSVPGVKRKAVEAERRLADRRLDGHMRGDPQQPDR